MGCFYLLPKKYGDSTKMQQSEQMEAYQPPKIEGVISQEVIGRVEQDN